MGRQKYLKYLERLFNNSPVISYNSIQRLINDKKKVKQYTKQLIKNLIAKGKIKKLTKGFYSIHDESSLAVFCFKPAYLGLQDALSFHNIWEQETIPVIITTRNIRSGLRKVLGTNILIRKINKKYFLGFEYYQSNNFFLPYSDIEKTFIDMIYFNQKLDKETLNNFKKIINKEKLKKYIKLYPKKYKFQINKILNLS